MMEYGQYVCNCEILHTGIILPDGSMVNQWEATEKLEEVIRCRDCNWINTTFAFPDEYENRNPEWFCDKLGRMTKPDGFCAWAERDV